MLQEKGVWNQLEWPRASWVNWWWARHVPHGALTPPLLSTLCVMPQNFRHTNLQKIKKYNKLNTKKDYKILEKMGQWPQAQSAPSPNACVTNATNPPENIFSQPHSLTQDRQLFLGLALPNKRRNPWEKARLKTRDLHLGRHQLPQREHWPMCAPKK